jgi:putrescine transport system ATP-binding protein
MVRAATINRQRAVENPIGYDEKIWVSFAADAGTMLTS